MSKKTFLIAGVIVALFLAGIVSYYAASSPDGLERVATDQKFIDHGKDGAAADSPLADYATKGVDNERLSGGLAGVIGVVLVLGIGTGVALLVRRRRSSGSIE